MRVLLIRTSLVMVTVGAISGCVHQQPKVQYVYVPIPLDRPVRPEFPKVKGTDLMCVSSDTKQLLLNRDNIMKDYMNKLEATIDATKLTNQ